MLIFKKSYRNLAGSLMAKLSKLPSRCAISFFNEKRKCTTSEHFGFKNWIFFDWVTEECGGYKSHKNWLYLSK